eukprot:scaffold5554_cov159-Cylindrotheca_fusiformis.AAC.3
MTPNSSWRAFEKSQVKISLAFRQSPDGESLGGVGGGVGSTGSLEGNGESEIVKVGFVDKVGTCPSMGASEVGEGLIAVGDTEGISVSKGIVVGITLGIDVGRLVSIIGNDDGASP